MKKALVITYYWPPSGGAGVQRWLKFTKYLRGFGWEPVIYTPENPENPEFDASLEKDIPEGMQVIRRPIWEPYSIYKRLLGRKKDDRIHAAFTSETRQNRFLESVSVWIRGNFFIPDARRFWIRPSVRFLVEYLASHPVDVIISTGPPHSMHLIAKEVSYSVRLPWLADFRDPWTNIDFYKDLRLTNRSDRKHKQLEKEVLKAATSVTVISRGMAEDFRRIVSRPYEVITNGFDPDDVQSDKPVVPDTRFSIAHIGTMSSSRNPVNLWKALRELIQDTPGLDRDLEIKLVGKVDFSVNQSLQESGLESFVRRIPYLPHDEVVMCQRQSRVLLLVINNTPNAGMILTGKFFEYLAAGRPILCIGPEGGDASAILEETDAGYIADFQDTVKTKALVAKLYAEFRENKIRTPSQAVNGYSRVGLTGKLADVLNKMTLR